MEWFYAFRKKFVQRNPSSSLFLCAMAVHYACCTGIMDTSALHIPFISSSNTSSSVDDWGRTKTILTPIDSHITIILLKLQSFRGFRDTIHEKDAHGDIQEDLKSSKNNQDEVSNWSILTKDPCTAIFDVIAEIVSPTEIEEIPTRKGNPGVCTSSPHVEENHSGANEGVLRSSDGVIHVYVLNLIALVSALSAWMPSLHVRLFARRLSKWDVCACIASCLVISLVSCVTVSSFDSLSHVGFCMAMHLPLHFLNSMHVSLCKTVEPPFAHVGWGKQSLRFGMAFIFWYVFNVFKHPSMHIYDTPTFYMSHTWAYVGILMVQSFLYSPVMWVMAHGRDDRC